MNDKPIPQEPETVSCDVCLTEIPGSVADTMEADDYVYHFCGINCYQQWQEKKESETE